MKTQNQQMFVTLALHPETPAATGREVAWKFLRSISHHRDVAATGEWGVKPIKGQRGAYRIALGLTRFRLSVRAVATRAAQVANESGVGFASFGWEGDALI